MLQRYLDGELAGEALAAFERELEGDPELREAHERSLAVEARLRELYSFEGAPDVLGEADRRDVRGHGGGRTERGRRRRGRVGLYGAGLALLVALCMSAFWYVGTPGRDEPVNAFAAHRGFVSYPDPDVVCDTPEKFAAYTDEKFGQRVLASFDTGVALIGWRGARGFYTEGKKGEPRVLLAYDLEGEPVVVVFQIRGAPEPELQDGAGLRMFSKRLGRVTAWEVTKGDGPAVLGALSVE